MNAERIGYAAFVPMGRIGQPDEIAEDAMQGRSLKFPLCSPAPGSRCDSVT